MDTDPLTTITLPCTEPAMVSGPQSTATFPTTESPAATVVAPVLRSPATPLKR